MSRILELAKTEGTDIARAAYTEGDEEADFFYTGKDLEFPTKAGEIIIGVRYRKHSSSKVWRAIHYSSLAHLQRLFWV